MMPFASIDDVLIRADVCFEDSIRQSQTMMLLRHMDSDEIGRYIEEARVKWLDGRARLRASLVQLVATSRTNESHNIQ